MILEYLNLIWFLIKLFLWPAIIPAMIFGIISGIIYYLILLKQFNKDQKEKEKLNLFENNVTTA